MGKTVVLGAIMQATGYAIIIAPPPFALFPVTYALFIGVGLALQLAQTVTYMSGVRNASLIMNYGQASYVSCRSGIPVTSKSVIAHIQTMSTELTSLL